MKKFENIEERIGKLNGKLWDFSFPKGTTRLWKYDFTERENKVFELFDEIMEKYEGNVPPPDVLERMNPLFNAMKRIWIQRAVDLFSGIVTPLIFMGHSEKEMKFDTWLIEAWLWNLIIFRAARDYNEENAWTNAVTEVFGHNDYDLLPDTEAEPVDPGWLRVEEIHAAHCAKLDKQDEETKKQFDKEWRERAR